MKDKLIYILILVIAFFMVTGAMFYGASTYINIFALDFTPVESDTVMAETSKVDSTITVKSEQTPKPVSVDSTKVPLAVRNAYQDSAAIQISASGITDKTNEILDQLKELKSQLANNNPVIASQPVSKLNSNLSTDSVYNKWVKSSVKLYEAMDSKKAAKIIQGYNDNIARDIIYSMKKKKAAEIIAEFKPDKANRIINLE